MKIHYLSAHSVLEYDEVQLLTDLGHEVFANGAYLDPKGHVTLPRPGIVGAKEWPEEIVQAARNFPKTDLPPELIEPFDVLIVMHTPEVLFRNWPKIKHKKVIWRSIGQSVGWIERKLKPLMYEGLIVVRYSPKEQNIPHYAGETAMIRFYKDPEVYKGWTGEEEKIVNFSQSLKGRRDFCHYDEIMHTIKHFNGTIYGPGNEDLGEFNGGQIPFERQLDVMRKSRVMVYGGTWPASYTLSFIEALMMGLPMVVISKAIAHVQRFEGIDFYECDEIMARISGPVCDNKEQMVVHVSQLMQNYDLAAEQSRRQRELAIELFGKETISKQWETLLSGLESESPKG